MKQLKHILFILCCVALPLCAQDNNKKYLAGAVPQVDGKVVFTKTFSIPGMSKAEIYDRMLKWMDKHLTQSGNNSLVAYTNEELGMVVGNGDEWLIFTSNALALDRCRILYKLTAACDEETCTLTIDRLRYIYREGAERYSGEEMISDKYALNKDQTKLVPGYAKWRKKTVDFVNDLCIEAADILSSADPLQTLTAKEQEEEAETAMVNSGTTVITPLAAKQTQTITAMPAAPVATDTHYIEVSPDELASDALRTASGTIVIAIGEGPDEVTVTPGAGGSLGKVNGKAVVFTILSPDQPYEALENAESYTVRFIPNGEADPSLVLTCMKLPSPATVEGMPRTYIGEITSALVYQP